MAFDGYIRVSSTRGRGGDSFISPDQQRKAIEAYATLAGITITVWHTDLDISGGKTTRPGLDLAMSRCETGLSEGIVVAKMDRFARSLLGALELFKRLDAAGAEFISVGEQLDSRGPAGKMMQRLMLVFAEFELDRIKDTWRNSQQAAVERGIHISSAVPVGYTRNNDRILEVDAKSAKHVRRAFEMAADGVQWKDIGAMLRQAGVSGAYGARHWEVRSVKLLITNPVYTGEARCGQFKNPTAHEPIVDRALFERASRPRMVMPPRSGASALLAGLIRCAGCQHVMKADKMTRVSGPRKGQRDRIYRCRGEYAAGLCPAPSSIAGWVIEPWITSQFFGNLELISVGGAPLESDRASLETEIADAIAELEAYRDQRIEDALGPDLFIEGLLKRRKAVDDLIAQMSELPSGGVQDFGTISELWPGLTVVEQRDLLTSGIDAVMVRRGRLPIDERALILWSGQLPDSVPKRGRRVAMTSFQWPDV